MVPASGRGVSASSSGIYIDPTPPNITMIYHLDLEWDGQEPNDFQGNNHTIAVYWEADDVDSDVRLRFIYVNLI